MKQKEGKMSVRIGIYKTDEKAKTPTIAYNGTSACFDIYATETVTIPARGRAFVPNGIRIMIPHGYYIRFADRSGNGIGKGLQIHQGIIDASYTGDLSIMVFNMTDEDKVIEAGKGVCQAEVMKIPEFELFEASEEDWNTYVGTSTRGENGFGSTDKEAK